MRLTSLLHHPGRIFLATILCFCFCMTVALAGGPLQIGTGEAGGVYLPLGTALAKLLSTPKAPMAPMESAGSVENIDNLLKGVVLLSLAQSDKQYQAIEGKAEWKGQPKQELRFLCSFHSEAVALVATEASGIRTLKDLQGKRVSIGPAGSGQHYNAIQALSAAGINWQSGITASELSAADSAAALQEGKLDAFFFTAGQPNGILTAAASGKLPVRFVPVDGEGIKILLEENPYLDACTIPAKKLYPACVNDDTPVATFGVVTTFLCDRILSDKDAYQFVKKIVESLPALQKEIPALADVKKEEMATVGRTAPLHPGALRYFQEASIPVK